MKFTILLVIFHGINLLSIADAERNDAEAKMRVRAHLTRIMPDEVDVLATEATVDYVGRVGTTPSEIPETVTTKWAKTSPGSGETVLYGEHLTTAKYDLHDLNHFNNEEQGATIEEDTTELPTLPTEIERKEIAEEKVTQVDLKKDDSTSSHEENIAPLEYIGQQRDHDEKSTTILEKTYHKPSVEQKEQQVVKENLPDPMNECKTDTTVHPVADKPQAKELPPSSASKKSSLRIPGSKKGKTHKKVTFLLPESYESVPEDENVQIYALDPVRVLPTGVGDHYKATAKNPEDDVTMSTQEPDTTEAEVTTSVYEAEPATLASETTTQTSITSTSATLSSMERPMPLFNHRPNKVISKDLTVFEDGFADSSKEPSSLSKPPVSGKSTDDSAQKETISSEFSDEYLKSDIDEAEDLKRIKDLLQKVKEEMGWTPEVTLTLPEVPDWIELDLTSKEDATSSDFQEGATKSKITIGSYTASLDSEEKKPKEQDLEFTDEEETSSEVSESFIPSSSYFSDFIKEEKSKSTSPKPSKFEVEKEETSSEEKAEVMRKTEELLESKEASTTENPDLFHYELDLRGPTFELKKSFGSLRMQSRRYRPRTIEHSRIDMSLLESELMSYRVGENETDALRELLQDPLKLEEDLGDTNRDYGSSFIIPVLQSIHYDNTTVPLIFSDIPVNVRVQLNLIHLANFDSEQMEYTVDLEMEMRWFDLRLRNNYTKPVLIREKAVIDKIWRPDPYFVNSKYSYFHFVTFPNFRMRITPQGLVTYTLRATLLPSCPMVFCKYPHDRQSCDLMLSSIAYPHSFVNFSWNTRGVVFSSPLALPELNIRKIETIHCEVEGKLIHSSCLRLNFLLERDGARFIVEKYVPSTLAMMFAWVAPYVPYNYEDVRIVTPIMVLLALVQMEKDDGSIRTSYLTSMNVWFGVMKAFSVLSLIESLVILAFIKRSRAMEKNASRAVTQLERETFLQEKRRSLRHAHVLDRICRFLSPFTFILFFVYYVLFVAQGDEKDCVRRQPYSFRV